MNGLRVSLFGKLRVQSGEQVLPGFHGHRVQDLFGYLLLCRNRPHPRENLAGLLWGDGPATSLKKHMRQALWQLQAALESAGEPHSSRVLRVAPDWVQVNPDADLWIDVVAFEEWFAPWQEVPGQKLDVQAAQALQQAVQLYQGDLLEGCYQDWCVYERERLQNMYLAVLDKLMGYCEAHREYGTGLVYGSRILRYDRASERTHRRLMRLHYLAGDRTAALRQYERCVAALGEELGADPSRRTEALYQQIRAEPFEGPTPHRRDAREAPEATPAAPADLTGHLNQLRAVLTDLEHQVQQVIQSVDLVLKRHR
jgi:DNA-binding SARP family transcriptional activator